MTIETETVLDRRRLRKRLTFWRLLAVVAGVLVLAIGGARLFKASTGETRHIARIAIEGLITEDRDQLKMLKELAESKTADGVVVYVNSPGGTTAGGEALFEALRTVAAKKPVVAQFGTIATSAAYIAGLATDHIVARGNTVTGSVGVIFQWAEFSDLLGKLGIKMNEIKSGPLKANPSPFQPLDDAGRETTQQMVLESQRWFNGLVSTRRGIALADVPGLEKGRVYSGRDAIAYKLVDEIGGEAEAVRWLEEKRGVTKNLKLVDWKPKRQRSWSWLGAVAGAIGALAGGQAEAVLRAAGEEAVARMSLDGLVSVWQFSEK